MLQNNQRFQDDVKRYTEAITKMEEGQIKIESTRLLNDLINEVKNLDGMFMDMVYAKQLPTLGAEMRDKIISIRKKLNQNMKITNNGN